MLDHDLIEHARKAHAQAYAPYTKRATGAAVRSADGRIFIGCSVETVAFTGSVCAEQVAIGNAIANGATDLVALALYPAAYPCGMCRQVMLEFNQDFVLVIEQEGQAKHIAMPDLLPYSFGPQKRSQFNQEPG